MAWNFELVAGPFKGRTGGLAWDGKCMLVSAVLEERVLRFDPQTGKAEDFRRWTGRVNGSPLASAASHSSSAPWSDDGPSRSRTGLPHASSFEWPVILTNASLT